MTEPIHQVTEAAGIAEDHPEVLHGLRRQASVLGLQEDHFDSRDDVRDRSDQDIGDLLGVRG